MKHKIVTILFCCCLPFLIAANWQDTLEGAFNEEFITTFDELAKWYPPTSSGQDYTAANQPKKHDGSASIWLGFSNAWSLGAGDEVIDDHGTGLVWESGNASAGYTHSGTTYNHSLIIDYSNSSGCTTEDQVGPSQMHAYWGDGTVNSGGADIHIFAMVYIPRGFYPTDLTNSNCNSNYHKWIEAKSGFTAVNVHGTTTERQTICDVAQSTEIYGTNFSIFNTYIKTSEGEIWLDDRRREASTGTCNESNCCPDDPTPPCAGCVFKTNHDDHFDVQVTTPITNGDWFGIEIRTSLGTYGGDDATLSFWVYDTDGTVLDSGTWTNRPSFEQWSTHLYNKITLGTNISCDPCYNSTGVTTHVNYWDDLIVVENGNLPNGYSKIGDKYFELLTESSMELSGNSVLSNGEIH